MTDRRTPRKHRGILRTDRVPVARATPAVDDNRRYSGLGGQFDDAGYRAGLGQFGFVHDVTPPTD